MTEPTIDNGQDRKARVKFGPRPNQSLPHDWAESALTWLFEHHPQTFGQAVQHAMGIEIKPRGRKPAQQ